MKILISKERAKTKTFMKVTVTTYLEVSNSYAERLTKEELARQILFQLIREMCELEERGMNGMDCIEFLDETGSTHSVSPLGTLQLKDRY